jgi:hypothetical protein
VVPTERAILMDIIKEKITGVDVFYVDGSHALFKCDEVRFTEAGFLFLEVDGKVTTIVGPMNVNVKWVDIHRDGYTNKEWQ